MTTDATHSLVTYTIDRRDHLISVNEAWTRFAEENGGEQLTAAAVTGQLLWDLIPPAEPLYAPILHAVRTQQRTVRLQFRCDGPTLRRLLAMDLLPGPDGLVEFRVRPVQIAPRPAVALLADTGTRSVEQLVVCSWCKRINVDVEWLEVEPALQRLRVFEHTALPRVSHGLCPRCGDGLLQAADADVEPWVTLPDTE